MACDNWQTPDYILDAVRQVFKGVIHLDPASCTSAQEGDGTPGHTGVDANHYFAEEMDGLARRWVAGNVWLNPPYSMPKVALFTAKAIAEYKAGHAEQILILVNNATETAWFQSLLKQYPVCFLAGRVKFWMPEKTDAPGARQGQAMFYLGPNFKLFRQVFRPMGTIRLPIDDIRALTRLDTRLQVRQP